MLTSEKPKEAVLYKKLQERLARKGNSKDIDYYLDISKKLGRSIFEVLCEIEKAFDYNDLANVFCECSGLQISDDIKGEILQATHHFIETSQGIYIWHYASRDAVAVNGKNVFIVSKTAFDSCTTVEASQIDNISLASIKEWFIQKILIPAVKINATDIHVVPKETTGAYKVYLRVLGDLKDIMTLSEKHGVAVASLLKYWAKDFTPSIRIDDIRRPQDGRIEVSRDQTGVALDMRLSFIPKPNMKDLDVVVRLLYKIELTRSTLHGLGFFERHEKLLSDISLKNKGIVLVTGATGTGKSRTINTILSKIDPSRNVLTVEDPVEYLLSNARQFQTFEWEGTGEKKSSVDFADFARAFKRHDPDIIFIGELRDKITAETAFHLSKTGHLVFATLHASRATMVPEMLFHDYGISVDEIADNLLLATNQVLVKRVCPKCAVKQTFNEAPEWLYLLPYSNKDEAIKRLMGKQVRAKNPAKHEKPLLGQLLLNAGVITAKQLEEGIQRQRTSGNGVRLGTVLVQLGHIDEKTIEGVLAEHKSVCSCVIRYENSAISAGYTGRTVLAECIPFAPQMFEDGNISVTAMDKKTAESGNILDDAVEKIQKGMIDIDALWRLI